MINLLIAGNKNVGPGLLIDLLSYRQYNDEAVTVYFLSMDLHEINPKFIMPSQKQAAYLDALLKEKNPESSFKLIDVTEQYKSYGAGKKYAKSYFTPYTQLRLYGDMIEGLPDKLLYVDTDVFFLKSISELFHMDLGDHEFAAARDYLGQTYINKNYQNAGVLLLNMKKIKETGLFEKCRQWLLQHHTKLQDQDSLNKNVIEKMFLPFKYNEQHHATDETCIRHFSRTIRWLPIFHTVVVKPQMGKEVVSKWEKSDRFNEVIDIFESKKDEFLSL